jgi:integrase
MISIHPGKGIVELKTASKKHRYYDEGKFKLVRELMAEHDPLLFFASKLVYYLCIRSEKELKNLKLENILIERKQVLIQAADSKTDTDRMIPIPDDLLSELISLKAEFPKAVYVIGVTSKNKFTAKNLPGPEPFGNGFLSKRFAKIRKLAGLTSDYTLFGMRHTRCIHLKLDGAKDSDIMNLMGHEDFATTAKYLRDLGIATDEGRISKLSRKF